MKKLFSFLALAVALISCGTASKARVINRSGNSTQAMITLNVNTVSISEEKTFQLEATIDPSLSRYLLFWSSENEDVATIDDHGLITAVKVGYTICVAQVGSYFARCAVEVTNYVPDDDLSVSFAKTSYNLNVNDTYELSPVVKLGKEVITDYTVTALISDNNIVSYSNNVITALRAGQCDILLTYSYLEYSIQQLLHVAVY